MICLVRLFSDSPLSFGPREISILPYTRPYQVFNVTLAEILVKEKALNVRKELELVPLFLQKTIRKMKELGALKHEGVFRVPGNGGDVNRAIDAINQGDWEARLDDVDSLASLVKTWLRTLHEPLISAEALREITIEEEVENCIRVANALDIEKRHTLMYLIGFLQEIANNVEFTKMTPSNSVVSMGRAFVRLPDIISLEEARNDPMSIAKDKLLVRLIEHWDTTLVYGSKVEEESEKKR
jgi:hypothetical protein